MSAYCDDLCTLLQISSLIYCQWSAALFDPLCWRA